MSHFSVLVITPTKPSDEDLDRILMPWHEYECTGYENEYVVDVDVTEKMIADHAEYGEGKPFGPEWVSEWSSADHRDGRYYKRTNPNAKWDWWQVGGRWTGMLVPHYDPRNDPANRQTCRLCAGTGKRADMPKQEKCNGCSGTGIETKWPTSWKPISGDQMRAGDIPFIALRNEAEHAALKRYDRAVKIIAGRSVPDFDVLVEKHGNIEDARKEYLAHEVLTDLRAHEDFVWVDDLKTFTLPRADVAKSARDSAVVPFAIVKDGKWHQRGEMGWWGVTRGEKEENVWNREVQNLFDGLSPDHWITVIDCHI